jgi:hypothetical protein
VFFWDPRLSRYPPRASYSQTAAWNNRLINKTSGKSNINTVSATWLSSRNVDLPGTST